MEVIQGFGPMMQLVARVSVPTALHGLTCCVMVTLKAETGDWKNSWFFDGASVIIANSDDNVCKDGFYTKIQDKGS